MCPNCILNQVGLAPGVYVAFGICGAFFVAAMAAMFWAFKTGEFDDMEGSKFDMLDDGDSTENATRAKLALDAARSAQVGN